MEVSLSETEQDTQGRQPHEDRGRDWRDVSVTEEPSGPLKQDKAGRIRLQGEEHGPADSSIWGLWAAEP